MNFLGYFLQYTADYFLKIDGVVALVVGYLFARWKFKFESIHERRLEVIEEAYSKLKLVNRSFRSLTAPLQEVGDLSESEKEKDFVSKANDMFIYLDTKKLFFSSEEQKNIDIITNKFFETWNSYRYKNDIKNDPGSQKEITRLYKEIWDSTSKEMPGLILSLEKIFKKALGLK
ncbi:hypothetical protein HY839_03770 [Candidatus Azambacteria bacterium]|nr:hypothetical protein [Candidatus Azambacteria bacterium]